jgi:tRNA(His) 5'-end guanylyltransferase
MDKTTLGDRMKAYEKCTEINMLTRVPIIIRVDGKNFSNWTKKNKFEKPFDLVFSEAMSFAMIEAASKIEGCKFGYTQSDEMLFILRNDQSLESVPWFNNRIQKICSITSSIVTANFNSYFNNKCLAYFDTRVFPVPDINETINCVIWRQNDAVKNSISCSCYYEVAKFVGKKTTRKLMHGLNQNKQQELLFSKAGINWNNYPISLKRGICCYKIKTEKEINGIMCTRSEWKNDINMVNVSTNRDWLLNILSI